MYAKVYSAAVIGLDAVPIEVEVEFIAGHLPCFTVVGLPDKAVQESKERVMSAIRKVIGNWPWKKVVVNLAPADIPKVGASFDLPIAIGVLAACGEIKIPKNTVFVGELSLEGHLRPVSGVLSVAEMAKANKFSQTIVPMANLKEAKYINGGVYGAKHLSDVVLHLKKDSKNRLPQLGVQEMSFGWYDEGEIDLGRVRGQLVARRALEVAAAGRHNLFMVGPPGGGKTLLANALRTILPPLTQEEAMEVTRIYSVAGQLRGNTDFAEYRPFRRPHHTASTISLVGGGSIPRPGEVTLAHKGVLFMDEFAEFPTQSLDALRQPIEDKTITIARVAGTATFPADFQLVAAMNPCPCGWLGDPRRECTCSTNLARNYQRRISGPLLDRFDLHVHVPRLDVDEKKNLPPLQTETTGEVRSKILAAREFAASQTPPKQNLERRILLDDVIEYANLTFEAKQKLRKAVTKHALSARGFTKMVRVSRTIANLDLSEQVKPKHVLEAVQYRANKER